jgi:hypothetical protein
MPLLLFKVLSVANGHSLPSGGVTLKRRCTYRPSVIYLIVNKKKMLIVKRCAIATAEEQGL